MGWVGADVGDADPDDAVKQVSFLHASAGTPLDEFRVALPRSRRGRTSPHARAVAVPRSTTSIDVERCAASTQAPASSRSPNCGSARSTTSCIRYFASPEDEAEFRSHEGFLDLAKAFSFVVLVAPVAGPAAGTRKPWTVTHEHSDRRARHRAERGSHHHAGRRRRWHPRRPRTCRPSATARMRDAVPAHAGVRVPERRHRRAR